MAKQKITFLVYQASIIAAIAGLLFGFDTGVVSGALLFLRETFHLTAWMQGAIVSSVLFGALIGALFSGRLTDQFGRRIVLIIIATVFTVGALGSALSPNTDLLIISRVILGLAIGVGSYTAPLYIAELAPLEQRGALVSLNQLMITIGILCSYLINYIFASEGSWRWMFAVGIVPAVLLGIGVFFLPESPRWLILKGKVDAARKVLQALRKQSNVDHEVTDIQNSLTDKKIGLKEVFAPWVLPVLLLGMLLSFLQQASGINVVIYYAPIIFKSAGFHGNTTSILATVGVGVINVIFTILSIYLVDKIGRRALLLTGIAGLTICLFVIGYAFNNPSLAADLKWVTLICLFIYIACFAFSLGAMLWLLVSEIFPLEVRGVAMGIAVAVCWASNMLVSFTFPELVKAIGTGDTFYIYAVCSIIGLVMCWKWVPETKGVSLESLEMKLRKRVKLRNIGA